MLPDNPFVKLSKPGTSFSDFNSGFNIANEQVKQVTKMTPLIQQWIMNGGLVITDETGEADELIPTPGPVVTTKSIGLGAGVSQPGKSKSKKAPADDPEREKTLEELLNEEGK